LLGDRLKVIRVYAAWISAQVVDLKAARDSAFCALIAATVGREEAATQTDAAVALFVNAPKP